MRRALLTHGVAAATLSAFAVYFAYDLVTFRRVLNHPDIYTYYYPLRQWFADQLRELRFPVWNPYWGIGHPFEAWASIPLDVYTLLELAVGAQYHWFQALQLLAVLGTVYIVFHRLAAEPLTAAVGAVLFFMTPLVTHWYFSFLIAPVYVGHALMFLFTWKWWEAARPRYLVFLSLTMAWTMLGTKLEFWFYEIMSAVFITVVFMLRDRADWRHRVRMAWPVLAALLAGIAANLWQLNLLLRLVAQSGRVAVDRAGFFRGELYVSLVASVVESPLVQLFVVGAACYGTVIWLGRVLPASRLVRHALVVVGVATGSGLAWLGWPAFAAIPNGSFERWVEGPAGSIQPEGFQYVRDGSCVDVRRLVGDAKDEKAAAVIRNPTAGRCFLRASLNGARLRGRYVTVRAWVRTRNDAPGAVQLDLQDGLDSPSVVDIPPAVGWQNVAVTRYVAPKAETVHVTLNVTDRARDEVAVDAIGLRARPVVVEAALRPFSLGALVGCLVLYFLIRADGRALLKAAVLLVPFLYYWARPVPGDQNEVAILALAPFLFQFLLGALVAVGCRLVGREPCPTVAYASVWFVLLMREQGQILLAYVAGGWWMPSRDNYLIDFAATILAVLGLSALTRAAASRWRPPFRHAISVAVPLAVAVLAVGASWQDPYYAQPLMWDAPPGYPFYRGVPVLREVFSTLPGVDSARVYFANHDGYGFTYGFGAALFERVGQVTMYGSLIDRRYKEWAIFQNLGIRPDQRWDGYPSGYSDRTVARLPRKDTLGLSNWVHFHHSVIARPPIRKDLLALLGVAYVVNLHPITGAALVAPLPRGQIDADIRALSPSAVRPIFGVARPGVASATALFTVGKPLPRAFVAHGVTSELLPLLQRELSPEVRDGALVVAGRLLQLTPARIVRYEPAEVTVDVETADDGLLVLTDLHHPFWSATVDGEPVEIVPALGLFRALGLRPGHHVVRFTCRVPYQRAAVAASALAVVAVLSFPVLHRRAVRGRAPRAPLR